MKQLLWINACMRGPEQSRTDRLCRAFLEVWKAHNPEGVVVERDLTGGTLPSLTAEKAQERDRAVRAGRMAAPELELARELAGADLVLVGAPYWDLSFPSALRVYLEWVSTLGVTFHYTAEGELVGLCKGRKLLYVTTAGGPVRGQNFGFEYVQALAAMLGIPAAQCVAAEDLDVKGGPGVENLRRIEEQLRELAEHW